MSNILTDDGCHIAYEVSGNLSGMPLILSPSLGTSMALFKKQLSDFERYFRVICYDPRGHGQSDSPLGGYSLDRLGRDVIEILDFLKLEKAHFCGVSLGGMTGQWMGYRAPERLGTLILANTSAYMPPPSSWADRIAAVLEYGMEPMIEPILSRWFTPGFRIEKSESVVAIKTLLETTTPQGYAGCAAAIRDMDLRITNKLITARTCIISGTKDPAMPPEHASIIADAIPGSEQVHLNAAHLSNVEAAPAFNAAVLAALLKT